jgi:hypothetical protein
MIEQAFDRRELQRYLANLRDNLDAPELREPAGRAAGVVAGEGDPTTKLRNSIRDVAPALASSGGDAADKVPFLARDPIQSLMQTSIESNLREQGVSDETPPLRELLSKIVHTVESLLHPVRFGPDDPDWIIRVGAAMLDRLAKGNHSFNPKPAIRTITDNARIVVVGDWGTGLPRARAVASYMADEVAQALAQGREVHVVHLGDVYYSGAEEEVQRNVLAPGLWPVTAEQARAGVTSWSLNGNHDMYGGGFGYFDRLLADERFSGQRSPGGATTSFFRLTSPSWEFVGLDTAWSTDVLSEGQKGVLQDPQAAFVSEVAGASDRKLMLLSHHQLISVYDADTDLGTELPAKLQPVLNSGRVTAWLWGHEHRCMGFDSNSGVRFPRCIGHGGVPVLMEHAAGDPIPAPGAWEERGFLDYDGDRWARFGFSILDLSAERIDVRYRDDQGALTRSEQII